MSKFDIKGPEQFLQPQKPTVYQEAKTTIVPNQITVSQTGLNIGEVGKAVANLGIAYTEMYNKDLYQRKQAAVDMELEIMQQNVKSQTSEGKIDAANEEVKKSGERLAKVLGYDATDPKAEMPTGLYGQLHTAVQKAMTSANYDIAAATRINKADIEATNFDIKMTERDIAAASRQQTPALAIEDLQAKINDIDTFLKARFPNGGDPEQMNPNERKLWASAQHEKVSALNGIAKLQDDMARTESARATAAEKGRAYDPDEMRSGTRILRNKAEVFKATTTATMDEFDRRGLKADSVYSELPPAVAGAVAEASKGLSELKYDYYQIATEQYARMLTREGWSQQDIQRVFEQPYGIDPEWFMSEDFLHFVGRDPDLNQVAFTDLADAKKAIDEANNTVIGKISATHTKLLDNAQQERKRQATVALQEFESAAKALKAEYTTATDAQKNVIGDQLFALRMQLEDRITALMAPVEPMFEDLSTSQIDWETGESFIQTKIGYNPRYSFEYNGIMSSAIKDRNPRFVNEHSEMTDLLKKADGSLAEVGYWIARTDQGVAQRDARASARLQKIALKAEAERREENEYLVSSINGDGRPSSLSPERRRKAVLNLLSQETGLPLFDAQGNATPARDFLAAYRQEQEKRNAQNAAGGKVENLRPLTLALLNDSGLLEETIADVFNRNGKIGCDELMVNLFFTLDQGRAYGPQTMTRTKNVQGTDWSLSTGIIRKIVEAASTNNEARKAIAILYLNSPPHIRTQLKKAMDSDQTMTLEERQTMHVARTMLDTCDSVIATSPDGLRAAPQVIKHILDPQHMEACANVKTLINSNIGKGVLTGELLRQARDNHANLPSGVTVAEVQTAIMIQNEIISPVIAGGKIAFNGDMGSAANIAASWNATDSKVISSFGNARQAMMSAAAYYYFDALDKERIEAPVSKRTEADQESVAKKAAQRQMEKWAEWHKFDGQIIEKVKVERQPSTSSVAPQAASAGAFAPKPAETKVVDTLPDGTQVHAVVKEELSPADKVKQVTDKPPLPPPVMLTLLTDEQAARYADAKKLQERYKTNDQSVDPTESEGLYFVKPAITSVENRVKEPSKQFSSFNGLRQLGSDMMPASDFALTGNVFTTEEALLYSNPFASLNASEQFGVAVSESGERDTKRDAKKTETAAMQFWTATRPQIDELLKIENPQDQLFHIMWEPITEHLSPQMKKNRVAYQQALEQIYPDFSKMSTLDIVAAQVAMYSSVNSQDTSAEHLHTEMAAKIPLLKEAILDGRINTRVVENNTRILTDDGSSSMEDERVPYLEVSINGTPIVAVMYSSGQSVSQDLREHPEYLRRVGMMDIERLRVELATSRDLQEERAEIEKLEHTSDGLLSLPRMDHLIKTWSKLHPDNRDDIWVYSNSPASWYTPGRQVIYRTRKRANGDIEVGRFYHGSEQNIHLLQTNSPIMPIYTRKANEQ